MATADMVESHDTGGIDEDIATELLLCDRNAGKNVLGTIEPGRARRAR